MRRSQQCFWSPRLFSHRKIPVLSNPFWQKPLDGANGWLQGGSGHSLFWLCSSPAHAFRTPGVSPTRNGVRAPLPLFLGPGFRLAARWNRLGETVKTRKKREKTGGKWARYGLKGVKSRDHLQAAGRASDTGSPSVVLWPCRSRESSSVREPCPPQRCAAREAGASSSGTARASCTERSLKRRRRPLFWEPFSAVAEPAAGLLVSLAGSLAPSGETGEKRRKSQQWARYGR